MKRLSGWSLCPLFLKFPILVYLQTENYESESEKTWSQHVPPGKRVKPSPNPSVAILRGSCCWGKSPFAYLQS